MRCLLIFIATEDANGDTMQIVGALLMVIGAIFLTLWFLSPLISIGYFIAFFVIKPTDNFYLLMGIIFFVVATSLAATFGYKAAKTDWKNETNGRLFSRRVKWPTE
jgi:hypothetical protein